MVLGVLVLAIVTAGVVVAVELFAPEQATQVDESAAAAGVSSSARVLETGTFSGKTGHQVAGTVTVFRDGTGYYLRFENYSQTQGPDVFVYLTPAGDPETTEEVEAGRKIRIDGGADGGESTKEGTFAQRLLDDVDPTQYNGVSIWCEDFGVPFGSATLR
ncbi:hypothetical protein BRC86_14190 [Halobacteriales archaeon QS_3_64_16]|nr:MAG: hypothetical protein BRC86_14190 [Halobacteriales archaeon QS_3_64_16]